MEEVDKAVNDDIQKQVAPQVVKEWPELVSFASSHDQDVLNKAMNSLDKDIE